MRNKLSKLALSATLGLALALIFSCSGNDGGEDNPSSHIAVSGSSSSGIENPSSSSDGNLSSTTSPAEPIVSVSVSKFVAEPYIETDKIKYSYSYGDYDFYYIYLGELKNIPLFGYPTEYHDGIKTTYTISNTESAKKNLEQTITDGSQRAIDIVEEHTYSTTNRQKVSAALKGSAGWGPFKVEAKATAEASWEQYTLDRNTSHFQQTTSLTNTITNGTEYTKTTMVTRSWELNNNDKVGYYKYTLFSTSDVYLYVIKNSKTGEIGYEFREYVIPDVYFWRFDYSETASFIKSDATSFEFDVSMLNNLPKPDIYFTPNYILITNARTGGSVELIPNQTTYEVGTQVTVTAKPDNNYVFEGWTGDLPVDVNASHASITFAINSNITLTANFRRVLNKIQEWKEYTVVGDTTYTFDKGFPATVEVYALGAGGGGQGGNRKNMSKTGTGAGGGGGAAVYANFSIEQPTTFSINVGKGGTGGGGVYEGNIFKATPPGAAGGNGGNTTVKWGNYTIAANGGGGGNNWSGGASGNAGSKPAIISETNWTTYNGTYGINGSEGSNVASSGGKAGKLTIGSVNPFGDGAGGVRNQSDAQTGGGGYGGYRDTENGSPGGNGQVIIVVTYTE